MFLKQFLNLPVPILDGERNLSFIFTLLCGVYEGLKAFIKPFEAPQRSVKINV